MNNWQITSASAMGTTHQLSGTNSQDAHVSISTEDAVIGYLADGCSSSVHSEVFSRLMVDYLARRTLVLLPRLKPPDLPRILFRNTLDYLKRILDNQGFTNYEQRQRFITDHCLFTIMGLVITDKFGLVLSCGDGIVVLDGQPLYIDQDNTPHYAAYNLQPDVIDNNKDVVPDGFTVWNFSPDAYTSVAVTSDAFFNDEQLLEQLPLVTKSSASLKLALNRWTIVQQLLDDDASVVFAKKLPEESHATTNLS